MVTRTLIVVAAIAVLSGCGSSCESLQEEIQDIGREINKNPESALDYAEELDGLRHIREASPLSWMSMFPITSPAKLRVPMIQRPSRGGTSCSSKGVASMSSMVSNKSATEVAMDSFMSNVPDSAMIK